jgi:hypothetical protein
LLRLAPQCHGSRKLHTAQQIISSGRATIGSAAHRNQLLLQPLWVTKRDSHPSHPWKQQYGAVLHRVDPRPQKKLRQARRIRDRDQRVAPGSNNAQCHSNRHHWWTSHDLRDSGAQKAPVDPVLPVENGPEQPLPSSLPLGRHVTGRTLPDCHRSSF